MTGEQLRKIFHNLELLQPDGTGRTQFERWDELAKTWTLASRTIDPISAFEVGHRVWINAPENADRRNPR